MSRTTALRHTRAGATPVTRAGILQRKCDCGSSGGDCEACRKKRDGLLQRSAQTLSPFNEVPVIVHEVLRSPGRPLERETRAFFEPRLGRDLSRVRIHTDRPAIDSARAVNAKAYTVGRDIVFGSGQYVPETNAGRRLLAHELMHVMQQEGGNTARAIEISSPTDWAERDADQAAAAVAYGHAVRPSEKARGPLVARFDIPLYDCPKRLAPTALRQAQTSGLPGIHNGPADAYRHCF